MLIKFNGCVINTDYIVAITKDGLLTTIEQPYIIYFVNDKHTTLTEHQYNQLIEVLKPMEIL